MKLNKQYRPTLNQTLQCSKNTYIFSINDNRKKTLAQAKLIYQMQQNPEKDEETKLENIKPDKIRPMQLKSIRKVPISPKQHITQFARLDIATGGPYEYAIDLFALGAGTGTTPATRMAVNAGLFRRIRLIFYTLFTILRLTQWLTQTDKPGQTLSYPILLFQAQIGMPDMH